MLKLTLQPVGDLSPIGRQSVPISPRQVAEDFTTKVFMKSVGDISAIDQPLFGDLSEN